MQLANLHWNNISNKLQFLPPDSLKMHITKWPSFSIWFNTEKYIHANYIVKLAYNHHCIKRQICCILQLVQSQKCRMWSKWYANDIDINDIISFHINMFKISKSSKKCGQNLHYKERNAHAFCFIILHHNCLKWSPSMAILDKSIPVIDK